MRKISRVATFRPFPPQTVKVHHRCCLSLSNKINTTRTFEARRARKSLSLPPSPVSAEWEQAGAHVPRAQVETRGHEIPRAFLAGERGRVVFRHRPLGKNLPRRWRTNTTRSRPRGRRRRTAGSSVGFGRLRSAASSAPNATAGRWRTRAAGSSAPTRTRGWRARPLEPRSRFGASSGGRRLREPFRVAALTGTGGRWITRGWRARPLEPRSRFGASSGGWRLREPFRVAASRRAARLRDGRRAVRVEHEHAVVGS